MLSTQEAIFILCRNDSTSYQNDLLGGLFFNYYFCLFLFICLFWVVCLFFNWSRVNHLPSSFILIIIIIVCVLCECVGNMWKSEGSMGQSVFPSHYVGVLGLELWSLDLSASTFTHESSLQSLSLFPREQPLVTLTGLAQLIMKSKMALDFGSSRLYSPNAGMAGTQCTRRPECSTISCLLFETGCLST